MLYWKNVIKSWIKSVAVLKKDLIVNRCTMKSKKKEKSYQGKIKKKFHVDGLDSVSYCIC